MIRFRMGLLDCCSGSRKTNLKKSTSSGVEPEDRGVPRRVDPESPPRAQPAPAPPAPPAAPPEPPPSAPHPEPPVVENAYLPLPGKNRARQWLCARPTKTLPHRVFRFPIKHKSLKLWCLALVWQMHARMRSCSWDGCLYETRASKSLSVATSCCTETDGAPALPPRVYDRLRSGGGTCALQMVPTRLLHRRMHITWCT